MPGSTFAPPPLIEERVDAEVLLRFGDGRVDRVELGPAYVEVSVEYDHSRYDVGGWNPDVVRTLPSSSRTTVTVTGYGPTRFTHTPAPGQRMPGPARDAVRQAAAEAVRRFRGQQHEPAQAVVSPARYTQLVDPPAEESAPWYERYGPDGLIEPLGEPWHERDLERGRWL